MGFWRINGKRIALTAKDKVDTITVMGRRDKQVNRMSCWDLWLCLIDYCVPRNEIDGQPTKLLLPLYNRNTLGLTSRNLIQLDTMGSLSFLPSVETYIRSQSLSPGAEGEVGLLED